jgi:hypothetical protein
MSALFVMTTADLEKVSSSATATLSAGDNYPVDETIVDIPSTRDSDSTLVDQEDGHEIRYKTLTWQKVRPLPAPSLQHRTANE